MKITTESFAKKLFSLINEDKKLLIGHYGGMDSLVLLDLCERIIPSGKLFAIHINHGLTKESDIHEKFVHKKCIDKNEDYGAEINLARYNKQRWPEIYIKILGIDTLNRAALFENAILKDLRLQSLKVIHKNAKLRNIAITSGLGY